MNISLVGKHRTNLNIRSDRQKYVHMLNSVQSNPSPIEAYDNAFE